MKDGDLRNDILEYIKKYGSSVSFIASNVGVSREHLSRWLNNKNYAISFALKENLTRFLFK